MRKTKIVCTLGPASEKEEVLRQMIEAGMDVARINFSHGTHEEHGKKLELLYRLRKEMKVPVAALLDTKGPEIRLGTFANGRETLQAGDTFTLTTEAMEGTREKASITFAGLPNDVKPGDAILIDDGLIELRVESVKAPEIVCTIINGGDVSNRKGINVPNVSLSMPYISEKDRDDILYGIQAGFDFIAASFTRNAQDIQQLRDLLKQNGGEAIKIIAKIENAEGVDNIDEIIRVSDGIMVARGDMGVEIPFEKVPKLQKDIIKKVYNSGKMVITATQMLESMTENPRPTRAEATDVANAIYDGTSAIMLSGETAAGKYPVESVRTMAKIAVETENDIDYNGRFRRFEDQSMRNVANAISHATCTTAYDLEASAIITVTESGQTARMISKYRPEMPIVGCTVNEKVYRQLALSWGVVPILCQGQETADALFEHAVERAKAENLISDGDLVVITAGVPLGIPGTTNLLKVQTVGDVILTAKGIGTQHVRAAVCVAKSEKEARQNFRAGDILVMEQTSNEIMDLLKKASGIIVSSKDENCHAAIVGLTLDIPVLIGAANCTNVLRSGTMIILDAEKGIVCNIVG
ncbi:MAG: pyruvate kinase [Oscillospiraceae bacterium]|nr:pyruvate kinase [Oscillospiraceae bacterium]